MIELTVEQIEKAERMLEHIPGAAPKAMARAINRATDSAKTEAARTVTRGYHIRHRDVLDTIKIHRATPDDLNAIILSRGNLIPLMKFRVSPNRPTPGKKRTVVARVKRNGGGSITNAFVTRLKNGHVGVFNRAGKRRFPIEQRYGPSVPEMLNSPSVTQRVQQMASVRLEQRLDHEIDRILEGHE